MADSTSWVAVCALDEIPLLGSRVLVRDGHDDIALFRPAERRVFALVDRCPHKGGPLSQGIVGCARRFDVQVRDGVVWLALSPQAPVGEAAHQQALA